jgi:hypothetical protein
VICCLSSWWEEGAVFQKEVGKNEDRDFLLFKSMVLVNFVHGLRAQLLKLGI